MVNIVKTERKRNERRERSFNTVPRDSGLKSIKENKMNKLHSPLQPKRDDIAAEYFESRSDLNSLYDWIDADDNPKKDYKLEEMVAPVISYLPQCKFYVTSKF